MSFCAHSQFLRNTRAVRTLATLWHSALLVAALGSRPFWHRRTHPGIFTKMTALNLWPCLKWKWASTTASEKVSSAVWAESSLQRKVSHMIFPIERVLLLSCADIPHVIMYDQSYLEPSEAPLSIWARAVSASEIEVHWKPIPFGSSRGKILAYEVGNDNYDIMVLQYRFSRMC